ncbi:MAG: hypothetical protein HGA41_07610 [Syntrophaceae bacterium]|nr:hypothetical protein [Syntrophaceae bacterium]
MPVRHAIRERKSRLLIDGLESTEGVSPTWLTCRRGEVEEIAGSLMTYGKK